MPAISQVQQQAAAIELEARKKGAAASRFKSMTNQQLEEYASTSRAGLPHRAPSQKAKRRRRIAEMRA